MLIGINYWAFPPDSKGKPISLIKAMQYAKELGYNTFEPTVDGDDAPVNLKTTKAEAEAIRKKADEIGLSIPTVASGLGWGVSPTHPDEEIRNQAIIQTKKILNIASWMGASTILYLPGMVSAPFVQDFQPQEYDKVDKRAKESLSRVLETASDVGVRIGVENVWNRYLLSPLEMRSFIDYFKTDLVGSYFDVGNTMLFGHPEHWIRILGKRIFAVHVKDFKRNVGNLDGFVDLLAGDVDYPAVMNAFQEVGYEEQFTVEYVPPTLGAAEKGIAAIKALQRQLREGG